MPAKRHPPEPTDLPPGCQALIAPPGTFCPRCRQPFPLGVAYDADPRRRGARSVAVCRDCLLKEVHAARWKDGG